MTRSKLMVGALLVVSLSAILAAGVWLGREGPFERPAAPPASTADATDETPGTVVVARDAQVQSGIATQAVGHASFHPAANGYATVVDLQPLLALHRQMVAGEAEVLSQQAAVSASQQELERSRALYADDRNVSRKAVQQAEASHRANEARLESAQASLREARAAADQQFGPTLAAWAARPSSPELARLASRSEVLVTVVLPDRIGDPPRVVRLAAPGYKDASAQLVSPSPRSDPRSAGRTYLYRSNVPYPTGLALEARIPLGDSAIEGFLVPQSAVIWYGDEAWAFVQQSPDRFVRRMLREPRSTPHGVFTTTAFAPGERVVTTGAELLQSEALRPRTPAASGCDDPECD